MNLGNEIEDSIYRIKSFVSGRDEGNYIFPLVIVLFLMLNILFIDQKVRFVMLGESLDSLQRELLIIHSRNADIEQEIAALAELPRIEQIATNYYMQVGDVANRIFVVWNDTNERRLSNETTAKRVWCKIKTQPDRKILPDDELVQEFRKW